MSYELCLPVRSASRRQLGSGCGRDPREWCEVVICIFLRFLRLLTFERTHAFSNKSR